MSDADWVKLFVGAVWIAGPVVGLCALSYIWHQIKEVFIGLPRYRSTLAEAAGDAFERCESDTRVTEINKSRTPLSEADKQYLHELYLTTAQRYIREHVETIEHMIERRRKLRMNAMGIKARRG